MSVKHTPGPWKCVPCGGNLQRILPAFDIEAGPRTIVSLITSNLSSAVRIEHAEADARLIAAAPDLLAAWVTFLSAQSTIDGAGFMDNHTDAARARESQAKAIEAARAAIAKAEGRE